MPELDETPAILLVAGSPLSTKSISRILSGLFNILHAVDSAAAWEMLQTESSIAAVVCELEKSIDQTALLERIRLAQDKTLASLPVLLLVGEADDEEKRDQAFSVGATDFINMPFSAVELKTRVRLHAKLYRLHSQEHAFEVSEQNSSIDLLNTLAQEQHFCSRLEQEISFSRRHKSYVSVCQIRIDKVDDLFDEYGRHVLSSIIRAVARQIEKQIRREDSFAYLGDSTFALLYPVTNGLGANIATQRLLDKIAASQMKHEGQPLSVTVSAGLYSTLPGEEETAQDMLHTVRQRVEKAQQLGGGQLISSKTEQQQSTLSIEQALNMISYGRTEGLDRQIPQLLEDMLPLIEFARQHNAVELQGICASLEATDS